MKRSICIVLALASLFSFISGSCTHTNPDETQQETGYNLNGVLLPDRIECKVGEMVQIRVVGGQGPLKGDKIIFTSGAGQEFVCDIVDVGDRYFAFIIPENFITGYYTVSFRHGDSVFKSGQVQVNVNYSIDVRPEKDATVYGIVECEGKGVPGVVVSDGHTVVVTDRNGIYNMASDKKNKYVFISVPSGYEVMRNGVLPVFYQSLSEAANVPERADFSLSTAPDQSNHTMLVFGDIHLANRTGDRAQFMEFTTDVNSYLAENKDKPVYGITLGDMSWDLYWITNSYDLNNYLIDMGSVKNLMIYHTIGNHDHEMNASGDFDTVTKYKKIVGPTYYSFNVGKVHYIVLDDIECTNNGTGDRTYVSRLVNEEMQWLEKDLSYVDKSVPVVIAMHAPVYSRSGLPSLRNELNLKNLLSGYNVHFLTGHTHTVYNIEKKDKNIFEHNSGAVCATWWWTAHETPGIHIGTDGAPGGYRVFDVSGTDFSWRFKATGRPAEYQFRTYDRNAMQLSAERYVPSAKDAYKSDFTKLAGDYASASADNYVYINVWDYDPEWTVTVTETLGGTDKELNVSQVTKKDPLHIISYPAKRWNKNKVPTSSFMTGNTSHIFQVKASSSTSTLEITVKDRFGRVYKERMKRPKEFSADNYK